MVTPRMKWRLARPAFHHLCRDTETGTYTVPVTHVSPFCMGHTFLEDGTVITGGGDVLGFGQDDELLR
jgi:hypothetical protein